MIAGVRAWVANEWPLPAVWQGGRALTESFQERASQRSMKACEGRFGAETRIEISPRCMHIAEGTFPQILWMLPSPRFKILSRFWSIALTFFNCLRQGSIVHGTKNHRMPKQCLKNQPFWEQFYQKPVQKYFAPMFEWFHLSIYNIFFFFFLLAPCWLRLNDGWNEREAAGSLGPAGVGNDFGQRRRERPGAGDGRGRQL